MLEFFIFARGVARLTVGFVINAGYACTLLYCGGCNLALEFSMSFFFINFVWGKLLRGRTVLADGKYAEEPNLTCQQVK